MVGLIKYDSQRGQQLANLLRHPGHPLLSRRKTADTNIYPLILTPAGQGLLHFQHGLFSEPD
jgi:hypothetical protein